MSELHVKFGILLQDERKRRRLDVAAISLELKIPEATLEAIELGDTEAVPEELYYNLFAKSYAEHLGIDYARTMDAIREEFGVSLDAGSNHNMNPKIESSDQGDPEVNGHDSSPATSGILKKALIIAGAVTVAFAGILVAWWLMGSDSDQSVTAESESISVSEAPRAADKTGPSGSAYDWNVPEYEVPDSIRLELIAREVSWATIFADGDTVHYKNLNPGRTYQLSAKHRLRVSIGVPRVVETRIDGRQAYLANAETGRISRVEIDQTNRDQFFDQPIRRPVRTAPVVARPDTTSDAASGPR